MHNHSSNLPTYKRPPVVEVALAVQFASPKNLGAAHLGAFWSSVRQDLPNVKSVQPIPPSSDDFDTLGQWIPPSLRFALTSKPDCRLQMTSNDEQWVWQIQSDRLVVNWRKRSEDYPNYDTTLATFKDAWQKWIQFLTTENFTLPKLLSWELTYVNCIPSGDDELWSSPSDWSKIFPGLWGGEFAAAPELTLRGLRGQWVWEHQEPRARLYVEPRPSRSNDTPARDLLILSLTARGPVTQVEDATDTVQAIESGLDLGHTLIVTTFDTLSSPRAKEHWVGHEQF